MDVIGKVANKKRLIDANALDERFDIRVEWLRLDVHDKYSLGLYHGAATDKDLIGEMPTVDAVPVVRCRECKHWHEETGFCEKHSYFVDGDGVCCSPADSPNWTMFDPDDFCSYGERKEGAD